MSEPTETGKAIAEALYGRERVAVVSDARWTQFFNQRAEEIDHAGHLAELEADRERIAWYFDIALARYEMRLVQQNDRWGWCDGAAIERSTPAFVHGGFFGWHDTWRAALDAARRDTPA